MEDEEELIFSFRPMVADEETIILRRFEVIEDSDDIKEVASDVCEPEGSVNEAEATDESTTCSTSCCCCLLSRVSMAGSLGEGSSCDLLTLTTIEAALALAGNTGRAFASAI